MKKLIYGIVILILFSTCKKQVNNTLQKTKQLEKMNPIKDPNLFKQVEERICHLVKELGLSIQSYTESPIKGGDGNREFLLWAKKE